MQIDGTIIQALGLTFAVVLVKPYVMTSPFLAANTRAIFEHLVRDFAKMPMILACQDCDGAFAYEGREDIVDFLVSIDSSTLPWKRYIVA